MKDAEFEVMCLSLQKGQEHFVENLQNHHAGKLIACHGNQVEVDIFGKRETWSRGECREFPRPDFDYHD
ncbi:hypothetical protein DESUT3_01070 [Desulfuromonas versatilis]|uniref:Uncharacterized protein n=1 Tax=Desulfuromonas versatilis TaxID=2802975 RepID=A0ABN6DS46_9BACT|nr:hypothetical protein [Desulfuromonas versatilis]BCR03038.1 hypothetical protein DESUT3_01070 [Desulfuromonas versatilis]